jgi:D-alanyl-D-alanine carboxypeptidase
MLSVAPSYTPGSKYEYSNAGYMIVGAVLEKISGKTWELLMREDLLQKLQM